MDLYSNYLRLEEMVVLMLKEMLVEMLLDPLLAVQEVMLVVKGESCDNWEIWWYVWGWVGSSNHSSVVKYVKAGFNVMNNDNVYWGVNRGVGYKWVICVYWKGKMSNVYPFWMLMMSYIDVLV